MRLASSNRHDFILKDNDLGVLGLSGTPKQHVLSHLREGKIGMDRRSFLKGGGLAAAAWQLSRCGEPEASCPHTIGANMISARDRW